MGDLPSINSLNEFKTVSTMIYITIGVDFVGNPPNLPPNNNLGGDVATY